MYISPSQLFHPEQPALASKIHGQTILLSSLFLVSEVQNEDIYTDQKHPG
jgi:hypothetical protein